MVENKGYSNPFNSRVHRQVKKHFDLPQPVNLIETPFYNHRSRNKLLDPLSSNYRMARTLEACQQHMHGSLPQPSGFRQEKIAEQTIPVRITNRSSKTYFSSPHWSNMSTSGFLYDRNNSTNNYFTTTNKILQDQRCSNLHNLIYVSMNDLSQSKNKPLPNFVPRLMLANTMSLVPKLLEVEEFLSRNSADIGSITVSWLKDGISDSVVEIQG